MYRLVLLLVFFVGAQGNVLKNASQNAYYLYTRDNPRTPFQIFNSVDSIVDIPVHMRLETAIVVHGHQGTAENTLNPVVKDAFISGEDVNVIVVDWSAIASQRYSNAADSVPAVALDIVNFIELMVIYQRIHPERLHLVGFDLGAHLVGHIGRTLQRNGPGWTVARITGLDPSGSRWGSDSGRLTTTDAKYVEVIHTDGDGLTANGIGTALGHVDFFANGGSSQPGCLTHSCSHNRAWELFAASLMYDHLVGYLCNSNKQLAFNLCRGYSLPMGNNEYVKYGSGIFRVNTGRVFPY